MDQRGFTVTIVLGWLLIPAAQGLLVPSPELPKEIMPSPSLAGSQSPARPAPFHPQRTMWGSREGLMAPLPANHGATKPSMSLAMPPAPARSTTTPTGSLSAPSPPTTTGGGGLRRNTAPPRHSFAGCNAPGSVAGSTSSDGSVFKRCVAAHRRTPHRFGVIVDHPQP
jgi:hypothetical protein